MTQEALRMAFDALKLVNIEFVCNGAHHAKKDRHSLDEDCPVTMRYRTAIAAIKEALAQEPVAWMVKGELYKTQQFHLEGGAYANQIPLYTTPPQRTWEGLSVFEINDLVESTEYEDYQDLVERTEAKLKEKNT